MQSTGHICDSLVVVRVLFVEITAEISSGYLLVKDGYTCHTADRTSTCSKPRSPDVNWESPQLWYYTIQ